MVQQHILLLLIEVKTSINLGFPAEKQSAGKLNQNTRLNARQLHMRGFNPKDPLISKTESPNTHAALRGFLQTVVVLACN